MPVANNGRDYPAVELDSTRDPPLVDDADHSKRRRAHWWQSSALLGGAVVGTGVLSLPYAASGLGWAVSSTVLLTFAFASTYAGMLLARVRNDYYPRCSSYADMAYAIAGPRFGLFTRCMIISGWIMLLPYFLIATADSLRVIFHKEASLCTWQWTVVVAALLLPPLQLTTLTSISYLTWPSSAAILVAVVLIVGGLAGGGTADGATRSGVTFVGLPPGASFLGRYGSLASFVRCSRWRAMSRGELRAGSLFCHCPRLVAIFTLPAQDPCMRSSYPHQARWPVSPCPPRTLACAPRTLIRPAPRGPVACAGLPAGLCLPGALHFPRGALRDD